MLAALAIWVVPRGFIKSLQPHYYPRVSYFYLSGVIISIPSLRAKLRNINVHFQLEKTNQKQNIKRKKKVLIYIFNSPYFKADLQILCILHYTWSGTTVINISIKPSRRNSEFSWELNLDLIWNPVKWRQRLHSVTDFGFWLRL